MDIDFLTDVYDMATDNSVEFMDSLKLSIGRYKLLNQVNEGGMKLIFEAVDQNTDRKVILAKPKSKSFNDQFLREAFITSYLQHPNIMPIYDIGIFEDQCPFFTMKKHDGSDWEDQLKDNYSLQDEIGHFTTVCEAVSYAHQRGVIHEDLKPANIRVGLFGEVIVCDWGASKLIFAKEEEHESLFDRETFQYIERVKQDKILGTPGYIAPERYSSTVPSAGHDIYALGAILYKILTGETPNTVESHSDLSIRCPSTKQNQKIPQGLRAICMKAMEADPTLRYHSIDELVADLKRYRNGYATEAEEANHSRVLNLMYQRNKTLFNTIFCFGFLISVLIVYSFIHISESRSVAIKERNEAILAKQEIEKLNDALIFQESERQRLLKQDSQRQFVIAQKLFEAGQITESKEMLGLAQKIAPEDKQISDYLERIAFCELNFTQSGDYRGELLGAESNLDSITVGSQLDMIQEALGYRMTLYFLRNCIQSKDVLDEKVMFYSYYLKVSHPGLESVPGIKGVDKGGERTINFYDALAIKNPGPLYLLKPNYVDLKNSGIVFPDSLSLCKELIGLSLQGTGILGAGALVIPSLQEINVSYTHSNDSEQFSGMPQLKSINIANSKIKYFSGFQKLKYLENLIVDTSQAEHAKKMLPNVKIIVQEP